MENQTIEKFTEQENRHPENAAGAWWVCDECIDCELCYQIAPDTFRRAEDFSQSIVYHQPKSEEEIAAAEEAMEECPVQSIHRDSLQ